jgi:predicted  nucleic acid-binding Zn-ribbon protein
MAKICINPNCEKEIPSSATYCTYCGEQQINDDELSVEEKLRGELTEADETVRILTKSLAEAQEEIETLEKKLSAGQSGQKDLQNLIDSKNREIEQLKMAVRKKKKSGGLVFLMVVFLLTTLVLSGVSVSLYDKLRQDSISAQSGTDSSGNLQDAVANLKSMNSKLENENQKLQQDYSNLQGKIKSNGNNSSNLQEEISDLKSTNSALENENKKLRQENISSQNTIANLKKRTPQKYETLDSKQAFYDKHGDYEYGHFPHKVVVNIYTQINGYGLSDDGWIPMSRLRKVE